VFAASASWGNETEWLDQFGTVGYDGATAIVRHSDRIYVTGRQAALPSQIQGNEAVASGFLRRYDMAGRLIWVRQFGFGIYGTEPFAMAVDASGLYLAGRWEGQWGGGAFVRKYDHDGNNTWTHLFARSDQKPAMIQAWAIGVDATGIYVAGDGGFWPGLGYNNALVSRLDLAGNEIWTRIAGTAFKDYWGSDEDAQATSIAIDDTGVYVSGTLGTADIRRYDVNGNVTATFGTGTVLGGGLALDDSGIYLAGAPCPPCQWALSLRKYDRTGAELWTRELPAEFPIGGRLALDGAGGLYIAGQGSHNLPEGPFNAYVRKYDVDGRFIWADEFGADPGETGANDIAADPTGVYVTGTTSGTFPGETATPYGDSFIIKRNENTAPKVQLLSLGDVNGDGRPELAALGHDRQKKLNWVVVKDAKANGKVSEFAIADDEPAAGMSAVPDLNGTGAPKLVILGASTRKAQVRDSLSGALVSTVAFDPNFVPVRLQSVPDQNANGSSELALLAEKDGAVRVEIRDALGGTLVRQIFFTPSKFFQPRDLAVLSDINQNGAAELAVIARTAVAGESDRVEIRDIATGELIRNISLGTGGQPLQLLALPDMNANGSPELAVMRKGFNRVVVKDARTGETVSVLAYNPAYTPLKMVVVPDFNGNGMPELALLQVRPTDGKVRAVIHDVATREWLGATYYGTSVAVRPDDIAVVPDLNSNGVPELGRLGVRGIDGATVVGIRDVRAGVIVRQAAYYP
jgi:hypothetical protein